MSFVDLAPTLVSLAGAKPPAWMQGHAFMGGHADPPQPYFFGFRGRMDERYDLVRSVRNQRYVYIRNYMPHLIYGQYVGYMFQTPTTQVWKRLYDAAKLAPPQTFFWEPKPAEELYDLSSDPDEVRNLAGSAEHRTVLDELRRAHRDHVLAIRDVGLLDEAEAHRRGAGTTIYEMGHDPSKYPLEAILDAAQLAAHRDTAAIPRLQQDLKHADSGVRYWAAMGLLIRGASAVTASRGALRSALEDASPSVRIVAARALGEYGDQADVASALAVLAQLAPADKNGAYVSMAAVNAVDALGTKAASLHPMLRTLPSKDPAAVGRANGYVDRLLEKIVGTAPAKPAAKPGGRKKAAQRLR